MTITITITISGPALVSSENNQGALEQATGRVVRLQIEGPCAEGYWWIRIQSKISSRKQCSRDGPEGIAPKPRC